MWRLVPARQQPRRWNFFCARSVYVQCCVRAVPTDTRPSRLRDVLRPHRNAMLQKQRAAGEELPAFARGCKALHPACSIWNCGCSAGSTARGQFVRGTKMTVRSYLRAVLLITGCHGLRTHSFALQPSGIPLHMSPCRSRTIHTHRPNHFHGKSCQSIDYKQDQH